MSAVAVDASADVYAADDAGNISRYNASGTLLITWPVSAGSPSVPQINGMAYSPANGNIYVADTANNDVLEFTTAGGLVASWGTFGNSPGQLNAPYGLAIDQTGSVYVSQPNQNGTNAAMIIQKFTAGGTYVGSYATLGQPTALSYTAPYLYAAEYSDVARINLSVPTPDISASSDVTNPGTSLTFDASHSILPFGQIVDYKWDFDGSGQYATDTGASSTVSHVFATPGTKTVSVEVTGSNGATATASVVITVPAPPSAAITSPTDGQSFSEYQNVTTSFSCSEGSAGPGIAYCSDLDWLRLWQRRQARHLVTGTPHLHGDRGLDGWPAGNHQHQLQGDWATDGEDLGPWLRPQLRAWGLRGHQLLVLLSPGRSRARLLPGLPP